MGAYKDYEQLVNLPSYCIIHLAYIHKYTTDAIEFYEACGRNTDKVLREKLVSYAITQCLANVGEHARVLLEKEPDAFPELNAFIERHIFQAVLVNPKLLYSNDYKDILK